ncbi:MAG TPA: hypothetical protein VGB55_02525 [Tepidisphaeraceae bacterium]
MKTGDVQSGRKLFATYGYSLAGGFVSSMSEASARDHLTGFRPDTAVIPADELRFVSLNNSTDNGSQLAAAAEKMAKALAQPSLDPRPITVTGFLPAEIDGRVSEIRYNASTYSTTLIVDGWASLSGGRVEGRRTGRSHGHSNSGTEHRGEGLRSQSHRTYAAAVTQSNPQQIKYGGSLARQSVLSTTPTLPLPTGFRIVFGQITSVVTGSVGKYNAKLYAGKIDPAATGAIAAAQVGNLSSTDIAVVWYLTDIGKSAHSLVAGQNFEGVATETDASGKLIVEVAALPTPIPAPTQLYQVYTPLGGSPLKPIWTMLRFNGDIQTQE